jgi:hypothetical protein
MWKVLKCSPALLALVKLPFDVTVSRKVMVLMRVVEMITCIHIIANTWRHW